MRHLEYEIIRSHGGLVIPVCECKDRPLAPVKMREIEEWHLKHRKEAARAGSLSTPRLVEYYRERANSICYSRAEREQFAALADELDRRAKDKKKDRIEQDTLF